MMPATPRKGLDSPPIVSPICPVAKKLKSGLIASRVNINGAENPAITARAVKARPVYTFQPALYFAVVPGEVVVAGRRLINVITIQQTATKRRNKMIVLKITKVVM